MKKVSLAALAFVLCSLAGTAHAQSIECNPFLRADGTLDPHLSRPEVTFDGDHIDVTLKMIMPSFGNRMNRVTHRLYATSRDLSTFDDQHGHAAIRRVDANTVALYVNNRVTTCAW